MPTASTQEKGAKQETRYSWWSWRRNRSSRETTPALDIPSATTAATTEEVIKEIASVSEVKAEGETEISKIEIQSKSVSLIIVGSSEVYIHDLRCFVIKY